VRITELNDLVLQVEITEAEYQEIVRLGRIRNNMSKQVDATPKNIGLPPEISNVDGMIGEWIFAKLYGKDEPGMHVEGDGGIDFRLDGWSIDVKFNNTRTGDLHFSCEAPFRTEVTFRAEIAVLFVRHSHLTYEFRGWSTRSHFERNSHPPKWNPRKTDINGNEVEVMVLEQRELHKIGAFLERFPSDLVTKYKNSTRATAPEVPTFGDTADIKTANSRRRK